METINQVLNKIKWDSNENPEEFSLGYLDRITNEIILIKYADIVRVEDVFFIIKVNSRETYIPLHRIKEILKNNVIIWQREY